MLADGDPARAVALASLLAVLVGVVMVVAGLARFGFVADLLSKPTQIGYMNGLALTIVVGQLPKLFGFSVDADGLMAEARAFVSGLAQGEANATAAVIGVGSLAGILLLNRLLPKLPSVLIVVVLAAVAGQRASTWRPTASTRSACSRRASRRSRSRRSAGATCRRCSSGRSPSPSSRSPTRCPRPRRSPPAGASGCAATRR